MVDLGTVADVLNHRFEEPVIEIALSFAGSVGQERASWRARADGQTGSDVLSCTTSDAVGRSSNMNLFLPGFQFLRADRITPNVTFPKSLHAVRHNRFLGPRGEFTAHYLLEFGAEKVRADALLHPSEPKSTSLLSQVNAWLQEFSPGVRVDVFPVEMTDYVRLAYFYRGKAASYDDAIRPTNVGFGLTHALPVVAACLGAVDGALLLIENPEAQLHPKGQFALGRLLALSAANNVQVIVESHSDHVLNGIRLAVKEGFIGPSQVAIHFFSRQAEGTSSMVSPEISKDGRLSEWPAGFFDEWERSLDKLLS